jgi:hypothetical protein
MVYVSTGTCTACYRLRMGHRLTIPWQVQATNLFQDSRPPLTWCQLRSFIETSTLPFRPMRPIPYFMVRSMLFIRESITAQGCCLWSSVITLFDWARRERICVRFYWISNSENCLRVQRCTTTLYYSSTGTLGEPDEPRSLDLEQRHHVLEIHRVNQRSHISRYPVAAERLY